MECVVNKWKDVILRNYCFKKKAFRFSKGFNKVSISKDLVAESSLIIPDVFFELKAFVLPALFRNG